jgi:cysteinyl-tRNA synthetase
VTHVRNFTDVDKRINETAQSAERRGAKGTLEDLIQERLDVRRSTGINEDMDGAGRTAARPCPT